MARLVSPGSTAVVDVSDELVGRFTAAGYTVEKTAPDDENPDGTPKGNASLEKWTDYALAQGKTAEELDGLKRDDVRALFTE